MTLTFALDFRELDRDLPPKERQAWNPIYASFEMWIGEAPAVPSGKERERLLLKKSGGHSVPAGLFD